MGEFVLTTTIDRPPATVFAFIAEPANMRRWYEAVEDVTVSGDPAGLGTNFQISRSLSGGRAINSVEITEYDPNCRVAFESRQGPTPFRYRYTLEPIGTGTGLTLEGHITSAGLAGSASHLGAVATQLFKRGMNRNLEVLKHLQLREQVTQTLSGGSASQNDPDITARRLLHRDKSGDSHSALSPIHCPSARRPASQRPPRPRPGSPGPEGSPRSLTPSPVASFDPPRHPAAQHDHIGCLAKLAATPSCLEHDSDIQHPSLVQPPFSDLQPQGTCLEGTRRPQAAHAQRHERHDAWWRSGSRHTASEATPPVAAIVKRTARHVHRSMEEDQRLGFAVGILKEVTMGPPIEEYLERIDATLAPYGGHFIVHGSQPELREGTSPGTLLVIEFPRRSNAAMEWYDSAAYQKILPLRSENSQSTIFIIDGVDRDHRATDVLR